MSGLRFAFVTTFYPPHNFGGDGIGVQRWARALARRGHHVSVICDVDVYDVLRGGAAPPPADEEEGITVHRLRSAVAPLSVLLTQQTGHPLVHGREIRRLLDEGQFDVINYHNVSAIGGPGVLAAGRAVKLYTAWEHWLVCPSHVLWRHNREPCTGRECLRCVLAFRRPPQLWRYTGFLDRQLAHVDAFIALSEFSRAKHREFGFSRDMEVIPGFLPDPRPGEEPAIARGAPPEVHDHAAADGTRNRVSAPDTDSPHHRPYFLFVGRLERIKGLDDVIPVFARYDAADLLVVGDGTHRAALEALARGNPRVRFLGALPQEALARYYAHAIAALVPTAGFETFGYVVIEAFRHGTPAIVRRIGPLPELITASGGGETFDNPAELASSMRRLQEDAPGRERLARSAYAGFLANWTESAVVPRYLALLDRVARARGQARVVRALAEGRAA